MSVCVSVVGASADVASQVCECVCASVVVIGGDRRRRRERRELRLLRALCECARRLQVCARRTNKRTSQQEKERERGRMNERKRSNSVSSLVQV